jgi:adenylate kinase
MDDFLSKKREFYIVDGYPRSLDQANVLLERVNSNIISNLIIVSLVVPDEQVLVSRLADRKNCNECGFSFSKKENLVCPCCSGSCYTREDDLLEEAIRKRIDLHNSSYDLIKGHLLENGFEILEFDVCSEKEVVYQNIETKLSKFFKK